jgi:hypothetical protein
MNKNIPTQSNLNTQRIVAILISIAAILDGFAMVSVFTPGMVLCEIVLVACATFQWSLYYNIKMRLEFYSLNSQGKEVERDCRKTKKQEL